MGDSQEPLVLYAIGDIHGQLEMLRELHRKILRYHRRYYGGWRGSLVYIGDYIDRGPSSRGVIDCVREGLPGFSSVFLRGNHEVMMMRCLEVDAREAWLQWVTNGGEETLNSFDYPIGQKGIDRDFLRQCVGDDRIDWLSSTRLTYVHADYLFVHAGVRPGVKLDKQREQDLLWIREPFLKSKKDFGHLVVHGHTPVDEPEVLPNRIDIDTGAGFDRKLTALVIDRPADELLEHPVFISAKG